MITAIGGALLTGSVAVAAPASIKLGNVTCISVHEGIVLSLRGERYEAGRFRCTARVTTDKQASDAPVRLTVTLLQKPEQATDKEERAKVERKLALGSSFKGEVEAELDQPESLNGCMPFTLVVEIGGQSKRIVSRPACD